MRFHHMALIVSDIQQAIRLWRDVLGFKLNIQCDIPDDPKPGATTAMDRRLLDDIFKTKNASSKVALLTSSDGALIELQQCQTPLVQKTPPENRRYGHTGIHELALLVEDIDYWFKIIRDAGYETQTEYIWTSGPLARSFLFYDADGNMIQLWEQAGDPTWDR